MTTTVSQYDLGLDKNDANHVALSPLSFLRRAAAVYPDRVSAVYEGRSFTWAETYERCKRMASFLTHNGIVRSDTVAAMLPNLPAMNELHFAVPMTGAVLNTLNTRLDASALAFMLDHGGAKILFVDPEFTGVMADALNRMNGPKPLVIDVADATFGGEPIGTIEYEAAVAAGDPDFDWELPTDEWDAIALSYTSGTTGNPKGVVTHHRGAYLNAVSNVLAGQISQHPVYLWTLPMFHCNGWCFPWTMAAVAGVNVCLRKVDPTVIFALNAKHGVTHMAGAPIVYNTLINAPDAPKAKPGATAITGLIAGAAPPMAVLSGAETIGIKLTHVYGLTEVYGPAAVCAEQEGWDALPADARANLKRRQGVPYPLQEAVTVLDPQTMREVPRDGETIGEVMFRGNIVMKGYLKNEKATTEAFEGGWFHTGDLGVLDVDGYVIIKDRSKDIIISGGENVSSVEVEDVLYKHPAVLFAAVVAKPDAKWGEVPCAFVELKDNAKASEADIIAFCRAQLPGFKTPKAVVFGDIPKTSTGKIQKFLLRDRVGSAKAISA